MFGVDMFPLFFFLIVFGFVALIVKMNLDYKRDRDRSLHGGGDSLGKSELRAMIQQAIEEAQAPLVEQLKEMEAQLARLKQPALPPSETRNLLNEPVLLAEKKSDADDRSLS